MPSDDLRDRLLGAVWGTFAGDALAMPVHWYYRRDALARDYGRVTDLVPPKNPHPDSILWRSSYRSPGPAGEILHDQAQYWGQRGVHYHQFLVAGESTLNLKLTELLLELLVERPDYDPGEYLQRYIHFLQSPGSHRDTYLEEYHRNFFRRLAQGVPPERCGSDDIHIGGLVSLAPLVARYFQTGRAVAMARQHVEITHGQPLLDAAGLVADFIEDLAAGADPASRLEAALADRRGPWEDTGSGLVRWLEQPDEVVIGSLLSPACYLPDALPATLYLARKYHDDLEAGLVANTNLGGDNCHRGAVLGAILGAANGFSSLPQRWVDGLEAGPRLRLLCSRLLDRAQMTPDAAA